MISFRAALMSLLLASAAQAQQTQSTVSPNVPAVGAIVEQSGPAFRSNFQAVINDLNVLFGRVGPSVTRIRLTAPLTLFADFVNGSNSNTCLAAGAGNACKTVQGAFNKVVANYDTAGFQVTISFNNDDTTCLAIGTAWTGGSPIFIVGPGGSPPTVGFNCPGAPAVNVGAPLPGPLILDGLELRGTYGILLTQAGQVRTRNVNYGAVSQSHIATQASGASVLCQNNYTVSGGAVSHWSAQYNSSIFCAGLTITLASSPVFSAFALAQINGALEASQDIFVGSVGGGLQYVVTGGAVINTSTGCMNYFPGTGFINSGGQCL